MNILMPGQGRISKPPLPKTVKEKRDLIILKLKFSVQQNIDIFNYKL